MSWQFNVSFTGETSIVFLETWVNCKVLSISNLSLLCYVVHQTSIIIFRLKFKLWVVNSMSVLLEKHLLFFSETWVNFKVMSILIIILHCYLVHQTSIITFKPKFKFWVVKSMSILLVKHLLFFLETWVNCKVLSILTVILRYYLVLQMSIITFKLEFKFWVMNSVLVLLVKHLLFFFLDLG